MTKEQIEAVAIAIRDVAANRSGRGKPWGDLPPDLREAYRDEARAAIKAYLGRTVSISGSQSPHSPQ